jgi:hypothetical protein
MAIRSFISWFMLISLPIQSEMTLDMASNFLDAFDQHKRVFEEVPGCSVSIPKIHSLQHYGQRTRDFGTPDNFDTEYTEHQHIIDTKQPYAHTNRKDLIPQMIKHVQRRMVLENKQMFLESLRPIQPAQEPSRRYFLGSRVKNCPMLISSVSSKYSLKDLDLYLRTFLHNKLFRDGEGVHHRVKKRKLPELEDPQVFFYLSILSF